MRYCARPPGWKIFTGIVLCMMSAGWLSPLVIWWLLSDRRYF